MATGESIKLGWLSGVHLNLLEEDDARLLGGDIGEVRRLRLTTKGSHAARTELTHFGAGAAPGLTSTARSGRLPAAAQFRPKAAQIERTIPASGLRWRFMPPFNEQARRHGQRCDADALPPSGANLHETFVGHGLDRERERGQGPTVHAVDDLRDRTAPAHRLDPVHGGDDPSWMDR